MKTNTMTIKEATQLMIEREFNAIPQSIITKAYFENEDYDSFHELGTQKLLKGDTVTYFEDNGDYTIVDTEVNGDDSNARLTDDDIIFLEVDKDKLEKIHYNDDILPIWSTMWWCDNFIGQWIEDNLETVISLGFRVYECDDLGIVIGIDGAGYDFYESHWIPLYKAQGLKWHL